MNLSPIPQSGLSRNDDSSHLLSMNNPADQTITLFIPQSAFVTSANNRFRASMEDTCTIVNNFMVHPQTPSHPLRLDTPFTSYYSVFDGHAGDYAAKWCADHLYKTVAKYLDLFTPHWSFPEIMASAFDEADRQIASHSPNEKSGCTASIAIVSLSARLPEPPKPLSVDKNTPESFSSSLSSTDSYESSGSYFSPPVYHPQQSSTPTIRRKIHRSYSSISPASSYSSSLSTPPFQSLNSSLLYRKENADQPIAKPTSSSTSTTPPATNPFRFNKYLYTCNVGDSRIVICSNGKARDLSYNHNAKDPSEQARINAIPGSFVSRDRFGLPRVNGFLAVSRALGDKSLKPAVSPRPFVTETLLDPEADELVILASDGLWDVCSSQEAVDIVRYIDDPAEASSALVRYALNNKSEDNITALVIRLKKASLETHPTLVKRTPSPLTPSLYHTYSTDTVNLTRLPTSTVSKHANTAPRPVNSSSSRSSTPRTSISSTVTISNNSNNTNSTSSSSIPVACNDFIGNNEITGMSKRSGTSSGRSDSNSSIKTLMMTTSTSPSDSSNFTTAPILSSANSGFSTLKSTAVSTPASSSKPSSHLSQSINSLSSGNRPPLASENLRCGSHSERLMDIKDSKNGKEFCTDSSLTKLKHERGVSVNDVGVEKNNSNATYNDDINMNDLEDYGVIEEEEGLFEADFITSTSTAGSSAPDINKENIPVGSEPLIKTSSIDTITESQPTTPSSLDQKRRRTSFVDFEASRPSNLLKNNCSSPSSPSVFTRSVKTRVGILEFTIDSPNKASSSSSSLHTNQHRSSPSSVTSLLSSGNPSTEQPKGFRNIMSNMPGGVTPCILSPRAVYREKLRSQSFSPSSLSFDTCNIDNLRKLTKYGVVCENSEGNSSSRQSPLLQGVQEGLLSEHSSIHNNFYDTDNCRYNTLSSGFSPYGNRSYYYNNETISSSFIKSSEPGSSIDEGLDRSEFDPRSTNPRDVTITNKDGEKNSAESRYSGIGRPINYNRHQQLGLEEIASSSVSSSTDSGSVGSLDRYGRFKPVIGVEFVDLDDSECAIADDDDDD